MKPKLVFIDHGDHVKTNSSRFFTNILERVFALEYVYVNPNEPVDPNIFHLASDVDRVVIWQMDYLAPITIAAGIPTIVVPMYDGSALMPDLHWQWSKQARFLNFSRRLHNRIVGLGNTSLLLKYFVRPVDQDKKAKFGNGLHALFWERRPEDGIHADLVQALFGAQLKALHLHECPDIKSQVKRSSANRRKQAPYRINKSSWFRRQSDFLDLMDRCNVFVCPRSAEGIGMAMLEALARGMLVVAHDDATHDEYIANWINGVLYNKNNVGQACFDNAHELGDMAWHGAVEGHKKWMESEEELLSFVANAPSPRLEQSEMSERVIQDLTKAYFNGPRTYERYLLRNLTAISKMSGQSEEELMGEDAFDPVPDDHAALLKHQKPALLKKRLISFNNDHNPYIELGWANPEPGWRWIEGKSASLIFSLPSSDLACTYLIFKGRTLKEIGKTANVCLILNNVVLGFTTVTANWADYEIAIPSGALGVKNRLRIYSSDSFRPVGDRRELSIALEYVEFF